MHRRFVPLEAGAWAPPLHWHGVVVQAIDRDEAAWRSHAYANFLSGDEAHGVLQLGGGRLNSLRGQSCQLLVVNLNL